MKFKLKKKKSFWDITMGVTQSMLASFLECKEKARLSYKEGWGSADPSNPLTFGTLFHECLDRVYSNNFKFDEKLINAVLEDFKKEWMEDRLWSVENQENHILNEGFLKILLPAYMSKYLERDRKKSWIAIETEFKNEVPGGVIFRGKFDRIARYTNGEKWIYETKTKSRIDPNIQNRLHLDLQLKFYLVNDWLTTKEFAKGVVYDIIQRPALRRGKTETLQHFMERVKGDVDDSYFHRIQVPFTEKEITEWYQGEFQSIKNEFYGWAVGSGPNYKNPTACETRYGQCKFINVCGMKDYTGLVKRKKVFSELEAI